MPDGKAALVYTTAPDADAARQLATRLLEAGLIACANIMPGMTAVYRWQGRVETAGEVAVILKTTQALAPEVVSAIQEHHPYETPAALIVGVDGGSEDFLNWISTEVAPAGT